MSSSIHDHDTPRLAPDADLPGGGTAAAPEDVHVKGEVDRSRIGIVDRAVNDKTRRVVIQYQTKHPKYGKYIRRRTILAVHDEDNESNRGDRVEIIPCRPMSKTKRWRLVRIVERAPESAR